jgi:hypothetical protein
MGMEWASKAGTGGGRRNVPVDAHGRNALRTFLLFVVAGALGGCRYGYFGECGSSTECGAGEICDYGECVPVFGRALQLEFDKVEWGESTIIYSGRYQVFASSSDSAETCSADWCDYTCRPELVCEFQVAEDTRLDISLRNEYEDEVTETLLQTWQGDDLVSAASGNWFYLYYGDVDVSGYIVPTPGEASR